MLSLSEALNNEFGQDNVTVSVLCPGPTETEFADRAEMTSARFIF